MDNPKDNMKFTYIYHSCFLVELEHYILLFDYYKAPKEKKSYIKSVFSSATNSNKKIIIFSSHSHYDHFNREVLDWDREYPNISYVLSYDIYESEKIPLKNNYYIAHKNEKIYLNSSLEIYSFDSTDLGVSFLIRAEELIIFHSGDLNWWNWGEEDTEEEAQEMESKFKSIIKEIEGVVKELGVIDIAFFPVDPRLGIYSKNGAEYFCKTLNPKLLVPMHYE